MLKVKGSFLSSLTNVWCHVSDVTVSLSQKLSPRPAAAQVKVQVHMYSVQVHMYSVQEHMY